ncbi:hypothetical protein D3C72_1815120 [compost metagenome]
MPDVGSQARLTEKTTMATIASQKSGTDAPMSEMLEAIRSKKPPERKAASEPTTIAAVVTSDMVMTASHSVQTKASSTTSSAGRAFLSDSPRSPVITSPA